MLFVWVYAALPSIGGLELIEGLSGITWSGFDNHYFLFTYEETRDAFSIPHDIKILEEVRPTSIIAVAKR